MPVSAKGSVELGLGLFVVGVRCAKSTARRIRRPAVEVGSVEATAATTAGRVELTIVAPERTSSNAVHAGPQYRYAVEVDAVPSGYVAALLDHGTASAVIVPSIEASDHEVVVPEVATALLNNLRVRAPWLRRVSMALHPDDASLSRALRLRGFGCEGEVPGYIDDAPGTRRQLWTAMLD